MGQGWGNLRNPGGNHSTGSLARDEDLLRIQDFKLLDKWQSKCYLGSQLYKSSLTYLHPGDGAQPVASPSE